MISAVEYREGGDAKAISFLKTVVALFNARREVAGSCVGMMVNLVRLILVSERFLCFTGGRSHGSV